MQTTEYMIKAPDAALIAAVTAAEAQALADHRAGTCHLSEFSCSHCEAAA